MPHSCIVPKCNTSYKKCKIKLSMFKVPTDNEIRSKWEAAIPGVSHLKPNHFVCEKHFEKNLIKRHYIHKDAAGKIIAKVEYKLARLMPAAIPTIFNTAGSNAASIESSGNISTQPSDNDNAKLTSTDSSKFFENSENNSKNKDHFSEVPTFNYIVPKIEICEEIKQPNDVDSIDSVPQTTLSNANSVQQCSTSSLHVISPTRIAADDPADSFVTLPESWFASAVTLKKGLYICLSHVTAIMNNDIATPTLKKSVMIDSARNLQYWVHGKLVEVEPRLPKSLLNVQTLPTVLSQFEEMHVCDGLPNEELFVMAGNKASRDNSGFWRHTECALLSMQKYCKVCVRLRKTLLQKKARMAAMRFQRISGVSEPSVGKQFQMLRSKLHFVKLQNVRVKHRAEGVKTDLNEMREQNNQKMKKKLAVKQKLARLTNQ